MTSSPSSKFPCSLQLIKPKLEAFMTNFGNAAIPIAGLRLISDSINDGQKENVIQTPVPAKQCRS
jgi:hypothetical protein